MATSGTYSEAPAFHRIISNAARRAGISADSIGVAQIEESIEELEGLFVNWDNDQINLWKIEEGIEVTPTQGDNFWDMPSGVIDLAEMTVRNPAPANTDVPAIAISREEYWDIPDKAQQGKPDRYYVQKKRDLVRRVYFWQAQGPTPYRLMCNYIYRIQTPGQLFNDPDVPPEAAEAVTAGLAKRLSVIHTPDRYQMLEREEIKALRPFRIGRPSSERAAMTIRPRRKRGLWRR